MVSKIQNKSTFFWGEGGGFRLIFCRKSEWWGKKKLSSEIFLENRRKKRNLNTQAPCTASLGSQPTLTQSCEVSCQVECTGLPDFASWDTTPAYQPNCNWSCNEGREWDEEIQECTRTRDRTCQENQITCSAFTLENGYYDNKNGNPIGNSAEECCNPVCDSGFTFDSSQASCLREVEPEPAEPAEPVGPTPTGNGPDNLFECTEAGWRAIGRCKVSDLCDYTHYIGETCCTHRDTTLLEPEGACRPTTRPTASVSRETTLSQKKKTPIIRFFLSDIFSLF